MSMIISGPPWLVSIGGNGIVQQSPEGVIAGLLSTGRRTFTLGGSSRTAYCHDPLTAAGLGATFANMGNGRCRVSGTKIARTFRKGMRIKVGGQTTDAFNQFSALILDHDTSTTMGWFEYDITGSMFTPSPTGATPELTIINEADNTPYASRGWATWASQLLGRGFQCLGNFAIAGGDSEQHTAILDRTVGVLKPHFHLWDWSTNDYHTSRAWTSARSIAANLAAAQKVRGYSTIGVCMLTAPRASITGSPLAEHLAGNQWAKENLPGMGIIVVDTAKTVANGVTFADTASAVFAANANMLHDGVHDDRAGARAIGVAVASAISSLVPSTATLCIASAAEAASAKSLFANVALAAGGTAASGAFSGSNLPTGVTVARSGAGASGTGVFSYVARTVAADGDAFGNWFVNTYSGPTVANETVTTTITIATPTVAQGDIVGASVRLKATGMDDVKQLSVRLRCRMTGEDAIFVDKFSPVYNLAGVGELTDDIIDTIDMPLLQTFAAGNNPLTISSLDILIEVVFNSTSGDFVLSIAQPTIIKATP